MTPSGKCPVCGRAMPYYYLQKSLPGCYGRKTNVRYNCDTCNLSVACYQLYEQPRSKQGEQ